MSFNTLNREGICFHVAPTVIYFNCFMNFNIARLEKVFTTNEILAISLSDIGIVSADDSYLPVTIRTWKGEIWNTGAHL